MKNRIEYYLNLVYYLFYLIGVQSYSILKKIDIERILSNKNKLSKWGPKPKDEVLQAVDDVIENRDNGVSISYTWVYFFILVISVFLFIILVIEDFLYGEIFGYASLELFVPPIIATIISYLFVLKNDKYLIYFEKFEKMPKVKIIRQILYIIISLTLYFGFVYWRLHY